MKKMKGVSVVNPRTRFNHQTLLQDLLDLQKETEDVRETLEMAKQKKLTLLAEVCFLRRRYKYLNGKQSPNPQTNRDDVQPQKPDARRRNNVKERKYGKRGTTIHSEKDAALQNCAPVINLNVKEMTSIGKEATVRNATPVFDLNQVSREGEEELDGGALRFEEAMKSSVGIVIGEQQHESKLSGCRNVGNGRSRAGKRKIRWEDQVALRA